jgi:hypothetical protein
MLPNSKQVNVTVNPDGTTKLDFNGFVGQSCLSEASKLTEALARLGITLEETAFMPKPELRATEIIEQTEQSNTLNHKLSQSH